MSTKKIIRMTDSFYAIEDKPKTNARTPQKLPLTTPESPEALLLLLLLLLLLVPELALERAPELVLEPVLARRTQGETGLRGHVGARRRKNDGHEKAAPL